MIPTEAKARRQQRAPARKRDETDISNHRIETQSQEGRQKTHFPANHC